MKTTTPVPPAARGSARSDAGLFSPNNVAVVIANIRQDLLAADLGESGLVAQYLIGADRFAGDADRAVVDKDLRSEIEHVLSRLFSKELTGEELPTLVKILYFAGQQRLLAKHHLRFPAYNILDEYFTNATAPWGPVVLPRPRVQGRKWYLFGQEIGFPIGVPASVLTGNARWIQYFASNGFNVLTYKTVRSRAQAPSEAPNWTFVPDIDEPWPISDSHYVVAADPLDWVDPGGRAVSTANSFGIPSSEPDEWMADVENALTVLAEDQVLIVSVVGDDYDGVSPRLDVIARDFAVTAKMAEDAGARIIELNLSCPNSLDRSGGVKLPICFDVELTTAIVHEVRQNLRASTKIVAKLSYLNDSRLVKLVHSIAPLVDGIAGINTLQCSVERPAGGETFPGRPLAGVSGFAISEYARDFVGRLVRLRFETGHYFEILGMGGVTDADSFATLYEIGANSVQSASGAFANPFLASEVVAQLGTVLPEAPPIHDEGLIESVGLAIAESMKISRGSVTRGQIVAALPLRTSQSVLLLERLEKEGVVEIPAW